MVEDEKTSKGKMEAKRSTVSLKEFIQRMLLYSGRYNFIDVSLTGSRWQSSRFSGMVDVETGQCNTVHIMAESALLVKYLS